MKLRDEIDNRFRTELPSPGDFAICCRDEKLLFAYDGENIVFPTVSQVGAAEQYLFTHGDARYFSADADPFGDFEYRSPWEMRDAPQKDPAFAGATALHLIRWYRSNRYCGRCGRGMRHSGTERAMVCDCGNTVYPRIDPAVIVGVLSRGRICLTKYNRENAKWALVAGYSEIGETAEQTVHREVLEETGLRVKNLRFWHSQPWGLSGSLLYGFFCEADGDDEIRVDHEELKEGRWFLPEEIDFGDDGFSLTREMIEAFRTGSV